jgi:transposase InsO family protein
MAASLLECGLVGGLGEADRELGRAPHVGARRVHLVAALVVGRRFRIMTLVDDFTRECFGLVVDTSLTGMRVVRELDRIAERRNYPRMIVSDNGTELTSNAILA